VAWSRASTCRAATSQARPRWAELGPKRLQMLRELLPTGATVALFTDPRNANAAAETREIEATAKVLGMRLLVLNATSPSELDAAFERMAQQDVRGLLNAADPFIISQRDRIVALAARRAIPGRLFGAPVRLRRRPHAGCTERGSRRNPQPFARRGRNSSRQLKSPASPGSS
jgi:hypothetical protein